MRKAICTVIIAVILVIPFSCYGYDEAYIEAPEAWLNNDKISTIDIEDSAINGYLQYYADAENHTFYGHISHDLNIKNSSIVYVGVKCDDAVNIEFDENGISDDDFKTGLAFYNCKNEIYFAVDFKDKNIRNSIDKLRITIRVEGRTYLICDYFSVDFKDPEKTTAEKQTTSKQSKAKTEKADTVASDKASAKSNKKETTTKFKYTYEKTEPAETEEATSELENQSESAYIITEDKSEKTAQLSATSKILISAAGIIAFSGIVLIIYSLVKPKSE